MAIQLACPCGKSLRLKNEMANKRIKCPACGKGLHVGAGADTDSSDADSTAEAKPRRSVLPMILGGALALAALLLIVSAITAIWLGMHSSGLQARLTAAENETAEHKETFEKFKREAEPAEQALRKRAAEAEKEVSNLAGELKKLSDHLRLATKDIEKLKADLTLTQDRYDKREAEFKKLLAGETPPVKTEDGKSPPALTTTFAGLPPDGAWAEYAIRTKIAGMEGLVVSHMRYLIGSTKHQGKDCRWLEVQVFNEKNELTTVTKLLFAIDGAKEKPVRKILRAIRKDGIHGFEELPVNGEEVKSFDLMFEPILRNRKDHGLATLKVNGIGMLECKHESGDVDPPFVDVDAPRQCKLTRWRSDKVPFHTVKSENFIGFKDGSELTFTMELVKIGADAKSEVPDNPKVSPGRIELAKYAGRLEGKGVSLTITADGRCDGNFNFGSVFSSLMNGRLQPDGRGYKLSFAVNTTFLNMMLRLSADENSISLVEPALNIVATLNRVK